MTIPQTKNRDTVDSVVNETVHRQTISHQGTVIVREDHADEDIKTFVENEFDNFNVEFSDPEPEPEPEPVRKRTRSQSRLKENVPEPPPMPFEPEPKQKKGRRAAKKVETDAPVPRRRRVIKVDLVDIDTDDE